MLSVFDTAKKSILNFPGKRLPRKYIVFESDDWGSERIPSKESLNYLSSAGIETHSNPFNFLDSLESDDDLNALFDTLLGHIDQEGNHPVITANSVMGNPDFDRIKASGFTEFYYENVQKTYKKKQGSENAFSVIRQGMSTGIYHPQFHGREHINSKNWLQALQSGNPVLRNAFNIGVYGIDLDIEFSNRNNFMAAFDSSLDQEVEEFGMVIKEGTSLFTDAFGYPSKSFIAPCYVWHPKLEIFLKDCGIDYIQGLPVQLTPNNGDKYKRIIHFQGQRNRNDQLYFIRNCFFEPALNQDFKWIEDCLRRLRIIFFWGKPAIIGTHRLNFIGSLNEENRTNNLLLFSELLKAILKTWPDVVFTTTDRLGDLY